MGAEAEMKRSNGKRRRILAVAAAVMVWAAAVGLMAAGGAGDIQSGAADAVATAGYLDYLDEDVAFGVSTGLAINGMIASATGVGTPIGLGLSAASL